MPNPHKRKMRKLMARKKKEDALEVEKPATAPLKKKAVKKEKKSLLETAADALRGGKEKE